jgi:hypothetical protein
MHEPEALTPGELEAQDALARLKPAAAQLTASRILFEVERRGVRRQVRAWRAVAASLGAGLLLSIFLRSPSRPIERIVYLAPVVQQQSTPALPKSYSATETSDVAGLTGEDYLSLRDRVFVVGVNALPEPAPAVAPPSPPQPNPRFETAPPRANVWSLFELLPQIPGGQS